MQCWRETLRVILPCALSRAEAKLHLTVTPLAFTVSGSVGDFTAPKIEMCSQLLDSVQEKYSIPCLESFLLLIIM